MGEPVKIVDLARDMIALSGLQPGVDIAIEFTGIRPGEKMYEELMLDDEAASATAHPKIRVARIAPQDPASMRATAERLDQLARNANNTTALRTELGALVPEARLTTPPASTMNDTSEDAVPPVAALVN
jgi:FlaA1/EpsC-like NDP-sugar epimerase